MFRKNKHIGLTATESYVVEMLRAILEEYLAQSRIYLTQIRITSNEVGKPDESLKRARKYTQDARNMTVKAFFTSLESPRRHGREGVLPVLPKVIASFLLTSETSGFYLWDLYRVELDVENWDVPISTIRLNFDGVGPGASHKLKTLSNELRHRGPTKFRKDE